VFGVKTVSRRDGFSVSRCTSRATLYVHCIRGEGGSPQALRTAVGDLFLNAMNQEQGNTKY
jgi:hypothetical protein